MAMLYVLQGPDKGRTFQVSDHCVLGRHSRDVLLSDSAISRQHAVLEFNDHHWRLVDLDSSNGTYVNGDRISGAISLKHGDQIKIGSSLLIFGGSRRDGNNAARTPESLLDLADSGRVVDASILSAIQPNDESAILAAPETAEAVRAWNVMNQLAEAIGAITSMQDLLERVADIIIQHLPSDHLMVFTPIEESRELEPLIARCRTGDAADQGTASRTIIQHVIDTKTGVLCANTLADERFGSDAKQSSLQSLATRSVICVPIIAHDTVQGVIHLDCAMSRHTYSHDQLRLVTAVGRMTGLAIENMRLIEIRMRNERLAAVGETVAYLSHHIRNILQGMRSGSDIVEMGIKKSDEKLLHTGWNVVQHNLDRIFQLTTNMLTFTKDRVPKIEMVQINNVVEDAIELAQRQASDHGITIRKDLGDIPATPVDPEGILQAIFNVLLNAIAACPEKSGRVSIKTSFDEGMEEVSLIVSDNGPGIPRDQIKRVFRPFYSSKGQAGTGLGLAATKKIIDELQGHISVRSAPGKGARITIKLPTRRDDTTESDKTHGPAK